LLKQEHVPVQRVNESADILTGMNAKVMKKVYPNMDHTFNQDEIQQAQQILF
jgi:predicted esterase